VYSDSPFVLVTWQLSTAFHVPAFMDNILGADLENVTEYRRWEVGHPESERARTCENWGQLERRKSDENG
jgi:hypothetical protein